MGHWNTRLSNLCFRISDISWTWAGYLKAVWPDFVGAFLRSGRPRGPGKAFQNVGGEAPTDLKASPGPRGRPDLKNAAKKIRPDCLQVPSIWDLGIQGTRPGTWLLPRPRSRDGVGGEAAFGRFLRARICRGRLDEPYTPPNGIVEDICSTPRPIACFDRRFLHPSCM